MAIKKVAAAIATIVIFGSLAFGDTVTVDFQDTTPGIYNLAFSRGYRFFNPTFSFPILSDGANTFFSPGADDIAMSRVDGSPFDLLQMDFRPINPPDGLSKWITIRGFFVNNSFQSMTFFNVNSPTFQTFDVGWKDVRSVQFAGFGTGWFYGVDNVVTSVQVPEPSTLASLTAGILIVMILHRRKTKEQPGP